MSSLEISVGLISEERLENAIRSNDLTLLQNLLGQGVEINHQDNDGNTVFHNAIRMDPHIDILKELLLNGSDVNIVNKTHFTSIMFAFSYGSDDFIYKLFALDHIHLVNFDDTIENSLLHVLPTRSNLTKSFMEALNDFQLDINTTNKFGDTPIHIICRVTAFEGLGKGRVAKHAKMKLFLNAFNGFYPFIGNSEGDTFLHIFFDRMEMDDDDVDFIDCLIGEGFRHITTEVVAKLLKYKNNIGNTPLHILTMNDVVQKRPDTSLIVLQKCFSAGVDINCINNLGESALHLLIQNTCTRPEFTFKKKNEEVLKYFIENRADINLQNVFGISPIFHCYSGDVRSVLLEMGADLNTQDKFGRTLLLAIFIYKPSAEEIANLLVRDVNLNQRDFHGNNALHYAVFHELDSDAVLYMIKSGIESKKDNQGTLPFEQALQRQNRELFRILSDDSNIIYQRYMYEFPNHIIEYKELVRDNFEKTAYVSKCLNLRSTEAFTDLFRLPFIGEQSCEKEADLIRSHITNLIQEIGRKLEGREKMFSNHIVISGSIGEGTKICYPDEFDFVCILDMFGQVCERDKGFCGDSGFTVLKLKENKDQSNHRWFFDRKGRLNVNTVRVRFAQLVKEILYDPVIWTSPYINLHFVTNQEAADEEVLPTCQFTINWVGHQYKDLIIKIDLVPACQISNFWPENTDLQKISCSDDKLQKDGCLLLFQCTEIFEQSEVKLRVSAVPAEKRLMETISKIATDSYMFSKLLCTDWVCSEIVIGKESFLVADFITSYMLKNCTFHVFHDNKMKGIAIEDIKSFTIQIFKTLLSFCENNNLPAFIFPFQNIFDFQRLESEESVRKECVHRGICAKIILSILGEKQVFTELREEDIIRNNFQESGSDDEVSMDECQDAVDPLEDFSNHSDFEFEK